MSARKDLTCVGLTILDILGKPVEEIPKGGKTTIIQQIRITPAGTAAGPAVIAAKLGLATALVGARGNDDMGSILEEMLKKQGVDTGFMQVRSDMPTSATMLAVNANCERPNFHAIGASVFLEIDEARRKCITGSRFVHWGGAGTMLNLDGGIGAEILKEAKSMGAVVTCDFIAPMPETLPALQRVMPQVDYFLPSLEEAMEVTGTKSAEDAGRAFLDMGAGCCIFKTGSKGSLLIERGRKLRVPAYRVEAYDTTGCGDAYCAGFIAALSHGWEIEKSCRFASAVAALVATGLGSDAGVTDFAAAERAMESLPVMDA